MNDIHIVFHKCCIINKILKKFEDNTACSVKCHSDLSKHVGFFHAPIYLTCHMANKAMLCQVDNVSYLPKVVLTVHANCNPDLNMV